MAPGARPRLNHAMMHFSFVAALLALLTAGPSLVAAKGDPERGKRLARDCFACHGPDGYSPSPINPKIGGQHERYIFMALQQYREGSRTHSLMRGSVLGKSDQDLEDIAAYYASQPGYLTRREIRERTRNGIPEGPPGSEGGMESGGGSAPPTFDHSDQIAKYNSMLAQALYDAAQLSTPASASSCDQLNGSADSDQDGDGLADAYDALPNDAGEFVKDENDDGYYEICNIYQLEAIGSLGTKEGKATTLARDQRMSRNYQVVRDLDASVIERFRPIGDCGPEGNCMITFDRYGFQGIVDGQGHSITGLRVSQPEGGGVGLFGVLGQRGTIRNLNLVDAVVLGRGGVGLMVGSNFGVIVNSKADGEVAGQLAVGGLVGGSAGLVAYSSATGTISGNQAIGGLVGDMRGAVYFSRADTQVAASRGMGGLVGLNTFGFILSSYANGTVVGENDVGGLVGMNTDGKVRNSYASVDVEGTGENIGGLVGFNSLSDVRNSFASGAVTGRDNVGGLVGRNNGSIKRSYAAGRVVSAGSAGGLSGVTVEGDIQASYWSTDAQTQGSVELSALTGQETGWAPDQAPVGDFLDYYCDANANGFIDPQERSAGNYAWVFGSSIPTLRCATRAGLQEN